MSNALRLPRLSPRERSGQAPLLAALHELGSQLAAGARDETAPGPGLMRQLADAVMFSSRRELIARHVVPPRPMVVAVLEGTKAVSEGGRREVLLAGDVLVVPDGVGFDASSMPDRKSGRFRSLVVMFDPDAGASLARRFPRLCVTPRVGAFDTSRAHVVRADPLSLQSLVHLGRTLLQGDVHEELVRHRVEDLLLTLSLQHTRDAGDGTDVSNGDIVLAVRQLVRGEPEAAWPAPIVARKLALSEATLRRRLAAARTSLGTLRSEERMLLASALLLDPAAQVGEVAARCGYQSPSKFARQFRRWFGKAPRAARA
jgi:AraC-like DNA-binding protein